MKVNLYGLDTFRASLLSKVTAANAAARSAVTTGALAIERNAKLNANTGTHRKGERTSAVHGAGPNVVTGNLRRSITHTATVPTGTLGWKATVGVDASAAPYGEWVEDDLDYPYFRPAVEATVPEIIAAFKVAMTGAIRA